MEPLTQADKRGVLTRFCAAAGSLPYRKYRQKDLKASQTKRRDTPGAADKLVKYIRALYSWGIAEGLVDFNPALGIGKINKSEGWHSWTAAELAQYRAYHALGTTARLCLELMLNSGARISDAARLGRQHEVDGGLRWTAWKNRNKNPVVIDIPITPDLRAALQVTDQVGDLTYLVTTHDVPFTVDGLGNRVRDWCDAAGLPHCTSHGLRKAAANELADNGASASELMAIFGWKRIETAETYVRAADKRRRAANAFARLDDYRKRKSVSLSGPEITSETKIGNSDAKSTPKSGVGGPTRTSATQ